MTSASACESRVKLRVMPAGFVSVQPIVSLWKKSFRVSRVALATAVSPEGCSG